MSIFESGYTPQSSGGFNPKQTGSAGYENFSQQFPFYRNASALHNIPEFERAPHLLEQTLLRKIGGVRANFVKSLYEYAQANGFISRPDVKFMVPIDIKPQDRFYLGIQSVAATNASFKTTLALSAFTKPGSIAFPGGNPNVVGDIARLQIGDMIMLMCSWTLPGRSAKTVYKESYSNPIPELCMITDINDTKNTITVLRHWAGSQRTATNPGTDAFTVVANDTSNPTSTQVLAKDAFFLRLPRAMKEDEIDSKIYSVTGTWTQVNMQRMLRAWGGDHMQEVISKNLGRGSTIAKNKAMAIEGYYKDLENVALFGERKEEYDENGKWQGYTDGLLANIPKSHYIGIKPIDYTTLNTATVDMGSFNPIIFNKLLEEKAYIGSGKKVLLCGGAVHTCFASMINMMTQAVAEIKSDWEVKGNRFTSSNGLEVDVLPTDAFSLNGFNNKAVLVDQAAFRVGGLEGYPTDVVEIANENPLKSNGFIHGVNFFFDEQPDAHWVFTLDSSANVLGSPLSIDA